MLWGRSPYFCSVCSSSQCGTSKCSAKPEKSYETINSRPQESLSKYPLPYSHLLVSRFSKYGNQLFTTGSRELASPCEWRTKVAIVCLTKEISCGWLPLSPSDVQRCRVHHFSTRNPPGSLVVSKKRFLISKNKAIQCCAGSHTGLDGKLPQPI